MPDYSDPRSEGRAQYGVDNPLHGRSSAMLGREGSVHPAWRGDQISYSAAHSRVKKLKGRAADYKCVDCDQQAKDWCYDRTCDKELAWDRDGKRTPIAYSPNPERYQPRCRKCHVAFDRSKAMIPLATTDAEAVKAAA